ncbi:hypothetical protein [Hoeflea sp.]|uniref:hypothetical protein n=1 Tax=Hoeflea sp. TaxID=1940281 RepID=UPI003A8E696F
MDELGNKLIEQAGPVGAALGVAILAAGAVLAKAKGWLGFGTPPKGNEPKAGTDGDVMTELRAINARLGTFDERIKEVEHDLQSRPTRQDMHKLETGFARMDERMIALNGTTNATGAAVSRIENFLISLSGKGK